MLRSEAWYHLSLQSFDERDEESAWIEGATADQYVKITLDRRAWRRNCLGSKLTPAKDKIAPALIAPPTLARVSDTALIEDEN